MIVYVATMGRSGSTFFRIILNKIFGHSSYAGLASSEDLTTIGAEDLSGYKPFSDLVPSWNSREGLYKSLKELDQSDEIYFIKTHSPNPLSSNTNLMSAHNISSEDQDDFRAIVIIRDGRDTYISFAKYLMNLKFTWKTWFSFSGNYPHRIVGVQRGASYILQEIHSFFLVLYGNLFKLFGQSNLLFASNLRMLVKSERWDKYHRRILERTGKTTLVYFDDLVRDPIATVQKALDDLDIPLQANENGRVPDFEELNQLFPQFFNSGQSGRWKKEMSASTHDLFWKTHGETMAKLGFRRE